MNVSTLLQAKKMETSNETENEDTEKKVQPRITTKNSIRSKMGNTITLIVHNVQYYRYNIGLYHLIVGSKCSLIILPANQITQTVRRTDGRTDGQSRWVIYLFGFHMATFHMNNHWNIRTHGYSPDGLIQELL